MRRSSFALWLCALASGSAHAAGDSRFDPARAAAPYFTDGPGKEARDALLRRDHAGCARALAGLDLAKATPETRLMHGYCLLESGRAHQALDALRGLTKALPLFADYVELYGAKAFLADGNPGDAITHARLVTAGSPLKAEAELVLGSALEAAGKKSEAADVYGAYVKKYPGSWRVGEVRGRWAEALELAGRKDEAQAVWREVWIESPISLGARAELRLDPARPLTADELARRAMVLFDAMRNKESETAWAAVLAVAELAPPLACRARYHLGQSVWKQRDRQRSAPLFEAAADACAAAKDADLTAKSLYQAGRAHGSRAEKDKDAGEKALALYARLFGEHAAHSYADDAALRRADVLDTLGRAEEATKQLGEIPDRFPAGDQRGEALFRLAFRAFEGGDAAGARPHLERELQLLPREEGWWEAGRTLYWLGRVHDALSAREQALTYFARAVREYPLSYYALMAMNRLMDADPAKAELLLEELSWKKEAAPVVGPVEDRPLFHTPAFQRALMLLRLGMGPEARRELMAAGLETPRRGAALPADRELGWVASRLFEATGDWAASHAYGRYVDTAYARAWPSGDGELKWQASFPRAYAALVEENVKKTGQPEALELAIMREESAFDPNLESFANAVGLTQLTAAPAARWAQGLPHDGKALRDPAINIAIGARELGALWSLFDKNAALAIAGYNAGEGAVKRWLRDPDNKDRQLDEFIERIPYDETRGYTKRVLGTYFTYAWLDRRAWPPASRVPRVKFTMPTQKKK